jgi:Arc/MetJ-type ribon-helix-helix transcriptional regulator
MKTLTVRLPEPLVADIEAESRGRKISKSDVVRERLERAPRKRRRERKRVRIRAKIREAFVERHLKNRASRLATLGRVIRGFWRSRSKGVASGLHSSYNPTDELI